jgi:Amt family ammonium transporter
MVGQVITQCWAVGLTLVWSGVGAVIIFFVIDKVWGFRPTAEVEQEGLDIAEHGERAYHY